MDRITCTHAMPKEDEISDFREDQWWFEELQKITKAPDRTLTVTDDLVRAVFVVQRLLQLIAAPQPPAAPGGEDALEKDRVRLQRRAFISGWDNRGMTHGLKGGVDTDDHMRKLMNALYPRDAMAAKGQEGTQKQKGGA